ncbi:U3 small nucleolar RNA-associated protein 25 [Paragonimus westermani]|uniref:U3 small nucleolar RNA-associated protein 25 n=1 Tax=Paragonimus westermani TaxID=34504 RepID=A0A5J4N8X0_9TREM|nr:U3 small nucleolar RNA-associated protein 25 [Paragonimus westermani]
MLLMQNWANVQKIVSLLNQRPTQAAFASAARIRLAYLAGYGRRYRQTLIFSAIATSLITLLTGDCENFQGLNFIPPWPHFNSIYPSHLPDSVRVPGAKRLHTHQISSPDAVKRLQSGAYIPPLTADVKLKLVTFAVSGQALSEVQMGNESDSQSSEDECDTGISMKPIVSPGVSSTGDQLTLSVQRIPNLSRSYMGGRAVPLARMNAFKLRVLPRLRRGTDPRVLIYVPDFYDLEELRVLLTAESLDFCCVNEYSEDSEAERFRTLFALGRIRIMLLSERYYFFRRRKIRGAQTFIFYGPPTFPWFVRELVEFSHSEGSVENQNTSTPVQLTFIYYPPYEAHQVSTITGKIDL